MLVKKIRVVSIIVACLFLLNFDISEAVCANKLTCLHLGQWSETTCSCSCLPGYSGATCEFGNCKVQPSDCINLSADLCSNQLIFNYCPKKCDAPICNCGYDTCENGGTFIPSGCSCTCLPSFTGIRCNTTISPTTTPITQPSNTSITPPPTKPDTPPTTPDTPPTTPVTPPSTPVTPPPTKPVTNQPIKCSYGFIFDLSTSKCICDDGFYGSKCENFNCSSEVEDDSDVCPGSSCDSDEIKRFCPNKCFCPKKPTCLPCYNNGKLNTTNCKCTCSADFTGEFCQYTVNPCDYEDPIECLSIDCWNAGETSFFKCQKKCLCCGNIKCDSLGTEEIVANDGECTCKCLNANYEEPSKCKIKETCVLNDPPFCIKQFKKTDCADRVVNSTCPIFCEACNGP